MIANRIHLILVSILSVSFAIAEDAEIVVDKQIHLRTTDKQEWSRFTKRPPGSSRAFTFQSERNEKPFCLVVRQVDVRQLWRIKINGKPIGQLKRDQNDLTTVFQISKGTLINGANRIEISTKDQKTPDDILVGPIVIEPDSRDRYLGTAKLELSTTSRNDETLPCRYTLVNKSGSLIPIGTQSNNQLAIREGVVYSADGKANISIPAGEYQIFVNRGFEYGQAKKSFSVSKGETKKLSFEINRVVDTHGWISCDTHIHTVTHSGHGDCTINERMITLAGENIELPIATDHNKQIDYRPTSLKLKTFSYFTPLIGNEVTTDFGHFNAFPFTPDAGIPNFKENDWSKLLPDIFAKPNVKVAILNHGRDVHRGYRPFAPENFNEATGESLNGRTFLFNAMEVINSAAQQTDQFELFRDWLAITNRGHKVLPIGSSDSHDVNAFIVGQGRTYIQCDDTNPNKIDTDRAIKNLLKGKISVSCGLLAKIKVNRKYGPGDLVAFDGKDKQNRKDEIEVSCTLAGPGWLPGSHIELYRNGERIQHSQIPVESNPALGQSANVVWKIKKREFDSFLTVMVFGPANQHPSWPLAQPYQPDSPDWEPKIFGFTGAVYLDENGDGKFNPAYETAQKVFKKSKGDLKTLVENLGNFDSAVAIQAASIYQKASKDLLAKEKAATWRSGKPSVRNGFTQFLQAWRKSESALIKQ